MSLYGYVINDGVKNRNGVPQGSVSGPLMVFIHKYYLPQVTTPFALFNVKLIIVSSLGNVITFYFTDD